MRIPFSCVRKVLRHYIYICIHVYECIYIYMYIASAPWNEVSRMRITLGCVRKVLRPYIYIYMYTCI